MDGITIRQIEPANPQDMRGMTYELWKGMETRQMTLCYRKCGTAAGNHFHTGRDISKNPERMLLISGAIEFIASNGKEILEEIIGKEGTEIIISPGIIHICRGLSDFVFIEQRKTPFNPEDSDTYSAHEFEGYLRAQKKEFDADILQKYYALLAGKR